MFSAMVRSASPVAAAAAGVVRLLGTGRRPGEGTNLRKITVRRAERRGGHQPAQDHGAQGRTPGRAPTCARSRCAGPNAGEGTNLRKITVRRAERRAGFEPATHGLGAVK